jgi:phage FluMu protein Com
MEYFRNLNKGYDYRQNLRDYVRIIKSDYLDFSKQTFKYQFLKYPKNILDNNKIISLLEEDKAFERIKSRPSRDRLIDEMSALIEDVNTKSTKIKNDLLFCLGCNKKLTERELDSFNYIKCSQCDTLIERKNNSYKLVILNPSLSVSDSKDWGMDYIKFNSKDI